MREKRDNTSNDPQNTYIHIKGVFIRVPKYIGIGTKQRLARVELVTKL